MWAFFTARIRQWLFFAVAIPLITMVVHALRQVIEKRSGPTRVTRLMKQAEDLGRRRRK